MVLGSQSVAKGRIVAFVAEPARFSRDWAVACVIVLAG